jgi:hypothetical protein
MPSSPLDKARATEVRWSSVAPLFDACRGIANPSYIYFIGEQDDGPVKIGLAKDPVKRVRQMQTGNPRRLKVEAVLVGDRATERLFHDLWAEYAVHAPHSDGKPESAPQTEWFSAEIRVPLYPIVADATAGQERYISDNPDALNLYDLEQIIRWAHIEHDHVAKGRDHVHLLANTSGYVTSRPTAI